MRMGEVCVEEITWFPTGSGKSAFVAIPTLRRTSHVSNLDALCHKVQKTVV